MKSEQALSRLAALFAAVHLLAPAPADAQLIGPDSTLQGTSPSFQGSSCPAGQQWINGGCGFTSSECMAATPGTQRVTALNDGSIWGNNQYGYTVNSDLSTAVMHAGLMTNGQSALIEVAPLDKKNAFPSSSYGGVTSNSYSSATCAMTLKVSGPISDPPPPPPCPSTNVTWYQYQGSWAANSNTSGYYYCSGALNQTPHGNSAWASLQGTDTRSGSALYSCSNGNWTLSSGSCDGRTITTSTYWYFSQSGNMGTVMNCFKQYLYRGMSQGDIKYYQDRMDAGATTAQICSNIQASAEATNASMYGRVSPNSELSICNGDSRFGYIHDVWGYSYLGNNCKSKP